MRVYASGHNKTTDERLLAAARSDNVELLEEVFEEPEGTFDINCRDGFVHGYTQIPARSHPST